MSGRRKPRSLKRDDSLCDGCIHYRPASGYWSDGKICHYCLDTGNPKRCRPWDCTHKVIGNPDEEEKKRRMKGWYG